MWLGDHNTNKGVRVKSKEDVKQYNAKYYREHAKELSEYRKKKYRENPEKYKQKCYEWVEKNREKWNAYMRERRKLDRKQDV